MMAGRPRTHGWYPVGAYALLTVANQMLWLTFAPLSSDAAAYYGVSPAAIGWLAQVFPLLYVLLALPSGVAIDRWFRPALGCGAVLTAAGALLRLVGPSYASALAGQLLVGLAQPLVLGAITKLAGSYLPPRDRPRGIGIASAAVFMGLVVALGMAVTLGGDSLLLLLRVQAAIAVLAALPLGHALLRPGRYSDASGAGPVTGGLPAVLRERYLLLLAGTVSAGFGVFIAVNTWLEPLLAPSGIGSSAAGTALLAMVLAGIAGSALLPPWLARHRLQTPALLISVAVTALGMLALALAPGPVLAVVVFALVGLVLLTDLPVIFEMAQRRAGSAGGAWSAVLWMAGNAGGLVAAFAVQQLLGRPAAAFGLLAVVIVLAVPFVLRLRRFREVTNDAPGDGLPG